MHSNSIGIKGAEAIASYLMQRNQLQSLMLSSNRICDDGAVAIAAVSNESVLPAGELVDAASEV